ncbi:MAG: AEC family transporter [Clostridiales bacterium]|nr:AEC family transporter [Clostridiales bacterium]
MLVFILIKQIIIMALLAGVGLVLCRKGLLSPSGTKDLGGILLKVVIPCVIVKSYLVDFSQERFNGLIVSAGLALTGFILAMLISWIVYGKRRPIENFAASFCNAGFIGIPLVQAVVGEEGVFYVAISIALLNLFQWTYGVYVITDCKDAISLKTIARNPVVIAIVIGLVLFLTPIQVPEILVSTLGYIAGMNTPVAMLLMGTYMARLSIGKILGATRAYSCVLFRLIVIPAVILLIYRILPVSNYQAVMTSYLAAITPVGANICIFAQQNNCDYELSVITVCLSTILSVITIPVLFMAAQTILVR